MRKLMKRCFVVFVTMLVMASGFSPGVFAAADDDNPTLSVKVANKVDVALAIGPTDVDYSTFEADLRAALDRKPHPIPKEDLYITAAKTVSANTTSEFSWWVYDHTKPATMESAASNKAKYGGSKNVSDKTHMYIENDLGNTTTSSSQGTVNRTEGSVTYTPDAGNLDIGSSRHPYQGINAHMIESAGGATMDFYGYAHDSYKDFRFLQNDQKTKKAFEFAIQEDLAYDALDGVGFFFNTDITGSYEAKTQTMSGYLLFLQYNSSGKGSSMDIYKFKDVNTYRFHQSMESTSATTTTSYTIASYKEGSANKFTKVASSSVYNGTDKYRRIKLEVFPNYVRAFYNGSVSDSKVLNTPIAENATPVSFSSKDKVDLDSSYISSYGFGPMSSYLNHTCARPTHLTLQKLSMSMDKVRTLPEVVREPDWHENTMKYMVNLNEDKIEDFSDASITAELLARLTVDDIYYIGWSSDTNAQDSRDFLKKHNLKGTVVNIEEEGTAKYKDQIQAIADEIYKRYWPDNKEEYVLVTDNVYLDVQPAAIKQNTADPEWPEGKWKVVHTPTDELGWDSGNEGRHPDSGVYMSDLEFKFDLPGKYEIYYRNAKVNELFSHRAPVAQFTADLSDMDDPVFTNTSYDPDDIAGGIDKDKTQWSWIDISKPEMTTPSQGLPQSIEKNHVYLITLSVTDKWGATSSVARQISIASEEEGSTVVEKNPPFAYFTLTPATIMKNIGNQSITIANGSYDLYGDPVTSTFTVEKDGKAFSGLSLSATGDGIYDLSALPAGAYKVSLKVKSVNGDSQSVARTFNIVEDKIAPTASADPTTATVTGSTSAKLSFSDMGGSGFDRQRAVVTASNVAPGDGAAFSAYSNLQTRSVAVKTAGANYIHWEAWDNAGNKNEGVFGPYTVNKLTTGLTLSASPQTQQTYGKGSVTLNARLKDSAIEYDDGSRVYFYAGDSLIGSGVIVKGESSGQYTASASIDYTPLAAGDISFKASFGGDGMHASAENTLAYKVDKNGDVTISVSELSDKVYDAQPYEAPNFTVKYGNSEIDSDFYTIEYKGIDGTSYGPSTTPPINAGKYTATGITKNANYTEKKVSAEFSIKPRELTIELTTDIVSGDGKTGDDVTLTAHIENAFNLPPGTVKFYANGELIGSAPVISSGGSYKAVTSAWTEVGAGEYDLSAVYEPASSDNYKMGEGGGNGKLQSYSVNRDDQKGFGFIGGGSVIKTYGDGDFNISATGGQGNGAVTYELIAGSASVAFDPDLRSVSVKGAGSAVIRATKAADENYNSTSADITITVKKADSQLSVAVQNIKFGETLNPVVSQNLSGGHVSYSWAGRAGTVYEASGTAPTAIGSYTLSATASETANYLGAAARADFEITDCDCVFESIDFEDAMVEIDYYKLEKETGLSSSAKFTGCAHHDKLLEISYELVGTSADAVVVNGENPKLIVNKQLAGGTVQVKVTYTHIATGKSMSKTAAFAISQGEAKDTHMPAYNKNDDSDMSVDITSYPEDKVDIEYDGKKLEEGKDYVVKDEKIVFEKDFLDTLQGGDNSIHVTIGDEDQDLNIHIDRGQISVNVAVDPEVPQVSAPKDLGDRVVSNTDKDKANSGYNVNIELQVSDLKDKGDVSIVDDNKGDAQIGTLIDVSPIRYVTGQEPQYIKTLPKVLGLYVDLPEALRGKEQYWVGRVHHTEQGEDIIFNLLEAELVNDGTQLYFETDMFSTMAILYRSAESAADEIAMDEVTADEPEKTAVDAPGDMNHQHAPKIDYPMLNSPGGADKSADDQNGKGEGSGEGIFKTPGSIAIDDKTIAAEAPAVKAVRIPITGDSISLSLWVSVMGVCVLSMFIMLMSRRKKDEDKEESEQ